MRVEAWRRLVVTAAAFGVACGAGVGCGGDDSTTIGVGDEGGVDADGAGTVTIDGVPGAGHAGTVVTYSNIGPGLVIAGVPSSGQYPTLSAVPGSSRISTPATARDSWPAAT